MAVRFFAILSALLGVAYVGSIAIIYSGWGHTVQVTGPMRTTSDDTIGRQIAEGVMGVSVFLVPTSGIAWLYFFALRHDRRYRRIQRGICTSCGYNLCATPDRCPECGTETKKPAIHSHPPNLS